MFYSYQVNYNTIKLIIIFLVKQLVICKIEFTFIFINNINQQVTQDVNVKIDSNLYFLGILNYWCMTLSKREICKAQECQLPCLCERSKQTKDALLKANNEIKIFIFILKLCIIRIYNLK